MELVGTPYNKYLLNPWRITPHASSTRTYASFIIILSFSFFFSTACKGTLQSNWQRSNLFDKDDSCPHWQLTIFRLQVCLFDRNTKIISTNNFKVSKINLKLITAWLITYWIYVYGYRVSETASWGKLLFKKFTAI